MLKNGGALLVLAAFLVAIPGCATLFNSGTADVSMSSEPSGADVFIDGNRMGTTPVTLELDNNSEHSVVFRRDGYSDVTCEVHTSVGAGWIVLDVLGGVVPVVIDAVTGKWNSLNSNNCTVMMRETNTN